MLARLEQNPHTAFTQRELTEAFPEEFEQARQQRLVRRVGVPPAQEPLVPTAIPLAVPGW